jgi:hypothetical protein
MRQFTISWATPVTLGLFYFVLGGVIVPFLSVHFKAIFCQSGVMSSMASATACGSMWPVMRDAPAHHIMSKAGHA